MRVGKIHMKGGHLDSLSLPVETSDPIAGSLSVGTTGIMQNTEEGAIPLRRRPTKLYDFEAHTFTPAGASGSLGPTLEQCLSEYGAEWVTEFFAVDNGIQVWTVPDNGVYQIECVGAQGARRRSRGAKMLGEFELRSGTKLNLVVGQAGLYGNYGRSGGGGGSFVYVNSGTKLSDLLIAAGGSGGDDQSATHLRGHALISENGSPGLGTINGAGGVEGNGGKGTTGSGGGAGFLSNGEAPESVTAAKCPANGAEGGNPGGGFGGGGAYSGSDRAGGGGGFSGGGGSRRNRYTSDRSVGGGGGSYNAGLNQDNEAEFNSSGDGYITIRKLSA